MPIVVNLDVMLAKRKMNLTELSLRVGITIANLSILKSGKAKAIRFSTLAEICKVLDCQPSDLLEYMDDENYKKLMGYDLSNKLFKYAKEKFFNSYNDIDKSLVNSCTTVHALFGLKILGCCGLELGLLGLVK